MDADLILPLVRGAGMTARRTMYLQAPPRVLSVTELDAMDAENDTAQPKTN